MNDEWGREDECGGANGARERVAHDERCGAEVAGAGGEDGREGDRVRGVPQRRAWRHRHVDGGDRRPCDDGDARRAQLAQPVLAHRLGAARSQGTTRAEEARDGRLSIKNNGSPRSSVRRRHLFRFPGPPFQAASMRNRPSLIFAFFISISM